MSKIITLDQIDYTESKTPTLAESDSSGAGYIHRASANNYRLDPSYPILVGLRMFLINNGGDANFLVGFDHGNNVLREPVHHENYLASTAVAMSERIYWFKPFNHAANEIKTIIENSAAMTSSATLKINIEFLLMKEENARKLFPEHCAVI